MQLPFDFKLNQKSQLRHLTNLFQQLQLTLYDESIEDDELTKKVKKWIKIDEEPKRT